jgi:hypothetical protein
MFEMNEDFFGNGENPTVTEPEFSLSAPWSRKRAMARTSTGNKACAVHYRRNR